MKIWIGDFLVVGKISLWFQFLRFSELPLRLPLKIGYFIIFLGQYGTLMVGIQKIRY